MRLWNQKFLASGFCQKSEEKKKEKRHTHPVASRTQAISLAPGSGSSRRRQKAIGSNVALGVVQDPCGDSTGSVEKVVCSLDILKPNKDRVTVRDRKEI